MDLGELVPLQRAFIILDAETTGPNATQDRIVELGFIRLRPDHPPQEWRSLVNPGIPIQPEATHGKGSYEGHGITDAMVQGCRLCAEPRARHNPTDLTCAFQGWPSFADLAPHLLKGFQDCDYGGFNVKIFDLPLLKAEFDRAGHTTWQYTDAKILDGYRLWQLGQKRSLSDAVEYFLHRKHEGAHGTLQDVRASLEVLTAQMEMFHTLPKTLDQLHNLQWPLDPNAIDPDGKFIWREGEAICNFGKKWKGIALAKIDKGYLKWMANGEFSSEVKHLVNEAMAGRLPVRKEQAHE